MDCPECKEPNMHLASHCTLWCMACDHTIGPDERIQALEQKVERYREAIYDMESTALGPVEKMRETGMVTFSYEKFCAVRAALEGGDGV